MNYSKPSNVLLLAILSFSLPIGGCDSRQDRARQAYEQYQAAEVSNDLPASRKALLALVTADDSVADYWIELGKVQLQFAEYGAAYTAFTRAHELDRSNASVLGILTQLELRSGDLDKAERTAGELNLVSPGNPAVSLTYGYVSLRRGKLDEAKTQADQLLASSPYDPNAKILRARILLAAQKPEEAIALLREQVRVQPSDQATLRVLRSMYELLDQWPDAAWAARNLLDRQPDDQDIRAKLVESELRAGSTERARADTGSGVFTANAKQIDTLLLPWTMMGKQSQVADLVFERGLSATGDRRLAFARFLSTAGRWAQVIKLTGNAATLPVKPANVGANALFGAALASLGRGAEGLDRLDRVIALDSANVDALRGRAQFWRMVRNYGPAAQDAQRLVAADRDSPSSWLLLADIQRSAGLTGESRRTLWDAFQYNPSDRSIFDALHAVVTETDGPLAGQRLAEEFRGQRSDEMARNFV